MIIFHEGMPGSGKSFAAMQDHIIPALKKGRHVYARMNGLDADKIAEVIGKTPEEVAELLHEIPESEVHATFAVKGEDWKIPPDCLVVLDELQNFYPQKRNALDPETTKFIAEHRHRGMDILCMGQLLKDCHRTWVNRVNRKIQFLNKDVLGKPTQYKWKMYNGHPDSKGAVVFNEVSSGSGEYDSKLFGTYKSFRDETENTERLSDDRTNIFKTKIFSRYLPAFAVVVLGAFGYLWHLFSGGLAPSTPSTPSQIAKPAQPAPQPVKVETYQDGKLVKVDGEVPGTKPDKSEHASPGQLEDTWPDIITEQAKENRPRLAYAIRSAATMRVVIEFRDKSNQITESLSHEQIKALGWSMMVSDDLRMVSLSRSGQRLLVTAWPLPEPVGRVPEPIQEQMRRESRQFAPVQPVTYEPQPRQGENMPLLKTASNG